MTWKQPVGKNKSGTFRNDQWSPMEVILCQQVACMGHGQVTCSSDIVMGIQRNRVVVERVEGAAPPEVCGVFGYLYILQIDSDWLIDISWLHEIAKITVLPRMNATSFWWQVPVVGISQQFYQFSPAPREDGVETTASRVLGKPLMTQPRCVPRANWPSQWPKMEGHPTHAQKFTKIKKQ